MNVHDYFRTCKTYNKYKEDKINNASVKMALIADIINPNTVKVKASTSSSSQSDELLKELKAIRALLEKGSVI